VTTPQRDLGGELGEAGSIEQAAGGDALVFVDYVDLCFAPAECDRASHKVVLAQGRLAVPLELSGAGLAYVDDSHPLPVDGTDFGIVHHARPAMPSSRSATVTGSPHSVHSRITHISNKRRRIRNNADCPDSASHTTDIRRPFPRAVSGVAAPPAGRPRPRDDDDRRPGGTLANTHAGDRQGRSGRDTRGK